MRLLIGILLLFFSTGLFAQHLTFQNYFTKEKEIVEDISFSVDWLIIYDNNIYLTSDAGENWVIESYLLKENYSFALIYYSGDEGETWFVVPDTVPNYLLLNIQTPGVIKNWIQNQNIDNKSFVVYPNPATDIVYVNTNSSKTDYYLINMTGKVIQHGCWNNSFNMLNIKDIKKGVYVLKLITDKRQDTFRIIKT